MIGLPPSFSRVESIMFLEEYQVNFGISIFVLCQLVSKTRHNIMMDKISLQQSIKIILISIYSNKWIK